MSAVYNETDLFDKNHFVSTGVLGEGGFGRVVAAMFVRTGNWYAVKEINKVSESFLISWCCNISVVLVVRACKA